MANLRSLQKAFFAIFSGFQLCLGNAQIRKLALWPWIIGVVSAVIALPVSFSYHSRLVAALTPAWGGIFHWLLAALAWIAASIGLVLASLLLSVLSVMIFSSFFQTAIATTVLRDRGVPLPKPAEGLMENTQEAVRSLRVQAIKLLWLTPLLILVFLVGLFPLFFPLALLAAAWILALQFVDVVLDLYQLSARERLGFCLKNKGVLCAFGLSLTLLGLIPVLGLFLPPFATAAAAALLADLGLLSSIPLRTEVVPSTGGPKN